MLRAKRHSGSRARTRAPAGVFHAYLAAFVDFSRATGATARTCETRGEVIGYFIAWCAERGIDKPQEVTRPILERYQRHLYHYRKANGEPLGYRTQVQRVVPLKSFFKWLARDNHILYNPAAELVMPRLPQRLPRHVLSPAEVQTILNTPDLATPQGIRDRAILETLYSTGMRRMELVNLKVFEADTERGSVMIREGKGRKDRLIPLGERAGAWIDKYRDQVRAQLTAASDDGTLFLTDYGEAFIKRRLGDLVRRYVEASNIGKHGSCHLFRHACATHMLENGADLRYIQALLGHADISTTQVYTEVSITKLKAVHALTHPAKLERTARTRPAQHAHTNAAGALMAALQAEHDAEEDDAKEDNGEDAARA